MAELVRLPDVAMIALRRREAAGLPTVGRSTVHDGDRVVAIGPDEWLIIGRDGDSEALMARWHRDESIAIDVSGNRVTYRLAGPGALTLLAAGCALDLERLKPDDAVSTLLARAQVVIVKENAHAWLVLPRRSFARYLEDWAEAAGLSQ